MLKNIKQFITNLLNKTDLDEKLQTYLNKLPHKEQFARGFLIGLITNFALVVTVLAIKAIL